MGKEWQSFIDLIDGVREADLIYKKSRIYIREAPVGYLIIVMEIYAPVALVRLNCDILLPTLKEKTETKGLGRFFKRKK